MAERVLNNGQQRITTTILLLKTIVDIIEEENATYLINPFKYVFKI